MPTGQITTYAQLASLLHTSPRAIGNALRNNPFAPEVPCHRVICADGYVGGFKGEFEKAPSGVNQQMKLQMLREEGILFDEEGWLVGSVNNGKHADSEKKDGERYGKGKRRGKISVWWTPPSTPT